MKGIKAALIGLALIAGAARADTTALILIRPEAAGPKVDIRTYIHENWVLWAAPVGEEGFNRVLSIASGVDWSGEPGDGSFRRLGEERPWVPTNLDSLRSRGYFNARSDAIGPVKIFAVQSAGNAVSRAALMVATDLNGEAAVLETGDPIPDGSAVVYGASGWDDARALAGRVDRAFIIEYPPSDGMRWSRMWIVGARPKGLPVESEVPGLISARSLLKVLIRPERVGWQEPPKSWTGANRWLDFVRVTGVETQIGLGLAGIIILWFAILSVGTERRSRTVLLAIRLLLLAPSAMLVGGNLAYRYGLGAWWPLFVATMALGAGLAHGLDRVFARWKPHPALGTAAVSLALTSSTDPVWSFFSPVFGHVQSSFSPAALGVMCASLAGVCAFSRIGGENALRPAELLKDPPKDTVVRSRFALAALTIAVACFFYRASQAGGNLFSSGAILLIASLVAGEAPPYGVLAMLAPVLAFSRLTHWVWTPNNLLHDFSQAGQNDVSKLILFLVSPGFVVMALSLTMACILADRFFWRQIRAAFASDWRNQALFWLAGAAFANGLVQGELWTSGFYILLAAILVLLFDAIWQL